MTTFHVYAGVPVDPLSFWEKIHPHPRYGFYLGSGAATEHDFLIYMSAGEPTRVLQTTADNAATLLDEIKSEFRPVKKTNLAFGSPPRFVGWLEFEAGRAFDPGIKRLPPQPNPLGTPGAVFGDYRAVVKVDFKKEVTTLYCREASSENEKIQARFEKNFGNVSLFVRRKFSSEKLQHPNLQRFGRMIKEAKEAIARGDIYQANLSLRFRGEFQGDVIHLYRDLCEKNPSPYACLFKCDEDWIVSCSPELLLKVEGGRAVTRPIAGTRPRGRTLSLDRRRQGQLLLSPKERAEHVMLVDLERNDLGRVCVPGSVRVKENRVVERYSHVMHIVSQVEGRLAPRKNSVDAIKAVFPGGTITGCPKIKAIELIEKIEGAARGPFYGSAGFFCENGDATFNILIRTAFIKKQKIFIQAGAGIVADSQPAREYNETLAKAAVLLQAAACPPSDRRR